MHSSIEARIARLMEQLARETTNKITVVFADGTRRLMDGGECIDLIMGNTANIGRFEGGGGGCGCLTDLLNGLLEI